MSTSFASANSCPKCGAALPSAATAGLCPRCLMAKAMVPTQSDAEPSATEKTKILYRMVEGAAVKKTSQSENPAAPKL